MFAPARSTAMMSVVLALGAACGSSPNGPTGPYAGNGGDAAAGADATPGDAIAETNSGVGLKCPDSFTGRAEGAPCFTVLTACDYPEGRCGCLVCEMGTQSFGYAWSCRPWESGGAGCPARSPPLGSPCDAAGLQCRYGAYCSVSVGDDLVCLDGTWQPAPPLDACGYRSCPF
jgi:hypothetical protein